MSVLQGNPVAYGFTDPLLSVPLRPIVSVRAPLPTDKAPIGTFWIDKLTNTAYILTSIVNNVANWEVTTNQNQDLISVQIQTNDANPHALLTIPIPANSAITFNGSIVAANAGFTESAGGFFSGSFYRAGGGAIRTGAPILAIVETTGGQIAFDINVAGNNAVFLVEGQAATVWNWKAVYYTVTLP